MAESKKTINVNIANLSSALAQIKDTNAAREDYTEVLRCLEYKDRSMVSTQKIRAILLKAINNEFTGISKDIIRMSLGLMLGYEQEIRIGERREKYLKYSNYTTDFTRKKEEYSKATKKQQGLYLTSLMNAETQRIKKLAMFLANVREKENFVEYISTLDDYYDEAKDTVILEEPYYMAVQKGSHDLEQKGIKKIVFDFNHHFSVTPLTAFTVFMMMITAAIYWNNDKTSNSEISQAKEDAEKIVPTKIEIKNKNIMLSLEEEGYLIVETEPDALNQNDLCYISSRPDIVRMEDIHSKYMIATDELAADARNYSDIVVHDIDGIAQDTATVIVCRTRKREAAIDDKNDDEASFTGFEANVDSE